MPMRHTDNLARRLRDLKERQGQARLAHDPVAFPHRYSDPMDIEVVGWLAAALAYGNVTAFSAVIEKWLVLTDGAPYRYFLNFQTDQERPRYANLYHRFATASDLFAFALMTHRILQTHGSLGQIFAEGFDEGDDDIHPALTRFVDAVRQQFEGQITPGLRHLLPSPEGGSACKRLNLYLRWMVRPADGIDFGLWTRIPPNRLLVPLDVHTFRIYRYLGLTRRKGANWKTAREITQILRQIDPTDPVGYDFALCHLGMSGDCPAIGQRDRCQVCPLLTTCQRGRRLTQLKIGKRLTPPSLSFE